MRKICSSHREKLLQILPVPSVLNFQTETIYLNSERSEQFWKPNTFLTCFWRLHTTDIPHIGTMRIPIITKNWDAQKQLKKIFKSSGKLKNNIFVLLKFALLQILIWIQTRVVE